MYLYIYIYISYICVCAKGGYEGGSQSKDGVSGKIGAGGQIFKPTCQPVSALKEKAI